MIDVELPLEGLIRESVVRMVQPIEMTWRVTAMLCLIGQTQRIEVRLLVPHVLVVPDHGYDLYYVRDVLFCSCASSGTLPHLLHNLSDL